MPCALFFVVALYCDNIDLEIEVLLCHNHFPLKDVCIKRGQGSDGNDNPSAAKPSFFVSKLAFAVFRGLKVLCQHSI